MGLMDKLQEDMKTALKSGEKEKLSTIRLVINDIKKEALNRSQELSEEEMILVLQRSLKQRIESIEIYKKSDRADLVLKEEKEKTIIESYLPKQLSENEVKDIVNKAIEETGAAEPKDIGKVMKAVMMQIKGRFDGKIIQSFVKEKLNG